MVTISQLKTITVDVVVAILAAVSYFFVKVDEKHEAHHREMLEKLKH